MYYPELIEAFLIGKYNITDKSTEELLKETDKREVYQFKINNLDTLGRVRKMLGILKSIYPLSLADFGTGRGAFLWPFMNQFPITKVLAIDTYKKRVITLETIEKGFQLLGNGDRFNFLDE